MSIQKDFILRYRTDGHIRFQIPALACDCFIAKAVTEDLLAQPGVYRVIFYKGQHKLSIRYHESLTDFDSIAKQLFSLLDELEKKGALEPKPASKSNLFSKWRQKVKSSLDDLTTTKWAKEKLDDAKDTINAAKILGKMGAKTPKALIKDPEKAIIDFLTDILVLFLIKMHWTSITQLWLMKPIKYRYELMAMFYMFYLLARSRKMK
jgi:hypothetical protein